MAEEAKTCSEAASNVRQGFTLWRNMVVELLASSEQEKGYTSQESRRITTGIASKEVEDNMQKEYLEQTKQEVENMKKRMDKAERRLGTHLDFMSASLALIQIIDLATQNLPKAWEAQAKAAMDSHVLTQTPTRDHHVLMRGS